MKIKRIFTALLWMTIALFSFKAVKKYCGDPRYCGDGEGED